MLNINNNAAKVKRDLLVSIAKLQLEGKLATSEISRIPKELAPRDKQPITCCIFHDRELLKMRILARMGISVEQYEEAKLLEDYAKDALEREAPTWPMLTVLHDACNACVKQDYIVTNACQGCFARPCMMNCPKKAITIKHHAHIDADKCIHCGICANNCPYHAIIKIPVPCEEACPVGAISKGEDGREQIDYHKCIFCGNCMRECPFGAMMDKSQLVDVIKHIMKKEKKIVAMYAPSIVPQFNANCDQFEQALRQCGFDKIMEVATGADVCAKHEAAEFEERMARGDKVMTTSCCSAYVRAVKKHVPDLIPCISHTKSPMHYIAEIAKQKYPDSITVFIGPCLAKRREGFTDDLVDYVISSEELNAFFIAKNIEPSKQEYEPKVKKASKIGRAFATSGGVAKAVLANMKDPSVMKLDVINGLDKNGMKKLKMYGEINAGRLEKTEEHGNLVEVMACTGGCISGPCVIVNPKKAEVSLKKYVDEGGE